MEELKMRNEEIYQWKNHVQVIISASIVFAASFHWNRNFTQTDTRFSCFIMLSMEKWAHFNDT